MMVRALMLSAALFLSACLEAGYYGLDWGKDFAEAEAWTTLALQGDAEAQYKVGQLNCCGDRPRYDNVRALFWFCKAARQGQRDAQYEIGHMYAEAHEFEGTIIPRNYAMALAYFKLAAMNGHDYADDEYDRLISILSDDIDVQQDADTLLDAWPNIPCEVYR